MVLSAVNIVLAIFIMLGAGMLMYRAGWINDGNLSLVSRLVMKVAFPSMVISNIFTNFDRASLVSSLGNVAAPFLSILLCLPPALLCAKLIRLPRGRRGVFSACFLFSNSVFIGVPVSTALFGEGVISYTLLYYIANTSLFWSMGVYMLGRDSGTAQSPEKADWRGLWAYFLARVMRKPDAKADPQYDGARLALSKLNKVLPAPLYTFIICVALMLCGVQPPAFILSASKYLGNMVTPLSLIYTGAVIMRMIRQKRVRWQKGYEWILLSRFALAPALMAGLAALFGMVPLMRNALIMEAAMPVMASIPIAAADSGSDGEYAAGAMALSTFLSLLVIPLYMLIL